MLYLVLHAFIYRDRRIQKLGIPPLIFQNQAHNKHFAQLQVTPCETEQKLKSIVLQEKEDNNEKHRGNTESLIQAKTRNQWNQNDTSNIGKAIF